MPCRTAISVFSIALLAGLSILGNGGKVSAGYLPINIDQFDNSTPAPERKNSDVGVAEQSSMATTVTPQLNDDRLPSSDLPEGPLASRQLLSLCFGIVGGRGNSSGGGAGSSSQNTGGSGPPLAYSNVPLAFLPDGLEYTQIDPDAGASTSMSSRLFRPPRQS